MTRNVEAACAERSTWARRRMMLMECVLSLPDDLPTPLGAPVRVCLVNEHPLIAEALGFAMSADSGIEYVGAATTDQEALEIIAERSPDVAVIDVDIPPAGDDSVDGIHLARLLKNARPETRVLILCNRMELDTLARAATEGACGFLAKTSSLEEIRLAVRTAKDGGIYVERELIGPLLGAVRSIAHPAMRGGSERADLTARELEVLTLLSEGVEVRVIAKRLAITLNTCRGHVKNVLMKLGCHSQLEAVVVAVHQGLLPRLAR